MVAYTDAVTIKPVDPSLMIFDVEGLEVTVWLAAGLI